MAISSLLKIISEKWVKPSSPTPPSCKYYKLSLWDQDMVDVLVSVAFFYPNQSFHGPKGRTELCQLLETSLSKTLTYYYPFAGRLMDNNISVDCNDAGVQLWEVQIQASMSEILDQPDCHAKDLVFPRGMYFYNSAVSSLLMIQLNHFECGGIGIGVCIAHKLGDAITLCNFVDDWAAMARGSQDQVPSPRLSGASVFPPSAHPLSKPSILSMEKPCVTRRFVFSASGISKLKTKVAADSRVQNPSKVEVVTALIFKSAMAAASRANSDSFKPSLLTQSANFRAMTIPPLSENYVGNFVTIFLITAAEEKETKLSGLVDALRKSKLQFQDRHRKSLEGNELTLQLSRDWEDLRKKSGSFDVYVSSSWCRLPFYQVDFGWGKPIYVCIASQLLKNMIFLMDTQSGDGIEAFVTLEEDEMSIFEHDEELLTFTSLNPNILGVNP